MRLHVAVYNLKTRTSGWSPISRTLFLGQKDAATRATSGGRLDPRVR
jgi:hypothetical protein